MTATPNPTVPAVDTRPDVPELRRLLDAATEGPWQIDGPWWYDDSDAAELVSGDGEQRRAVVIAPMKRDRRGLATYSDVRLIAALRNAAPWLLAQAAAVARVEAVVAKALREHSDDMTALAVRAALAGPGVSE